MKSAYILSMATILLFLNNAQAAQPEKEGTKVNIWIPGILIKLATDIAEDYIPEEEADVQMVMALAGKIGDINVCVREGDYYNVSDKKITRKINKLQKRNYEPLIKVIEDETHVQISIKQKKNGNIKRLAVLVDEKDETYVYAKMNCNIRMKDIGRMLSQYDLTEL